MKKSKAVEMLTSIRDRFYKEGASKDLLIAAHEMRSAVTKIAFEPPIDTELYLSSLSLFDEIRNSLNGCVTQLYRVGMAYPKCGHQQNGWFVIHVEVYRDIELVEVTWEPIPNVEQGPIDGS